MTELVMLALALAGFLCVASLPLGITVLVCAGFLQDVARKLVPNEPVYFTVVALGLAVVTFATAFVRGDIVPFRNIPDWKRRMRWPAEVFVAVVLLQSVAAYANMGSVVVASIGMVAYLSPFPAIQLGYSYAASLERAVSFLKIYTALSAAVTIGIYFSWFGLEWSLLRSVGEPLVVYSLETGQPLELPSGFLRSPEIAAWHAATAFCTALILGAIDRRPAGVALSAALAIFFMIAVFLSGRRKFLLEIIVFVPMLAVLLWHHRIGGRRFLRMLLAVTIVAPGIAVFGMFTDDTTTSRFGEASMRHEESTVAPVLARIHNLTIGSFEYIVAENGLLGSGAGSGSQGAQHFGGGSDVVGVAAEGGLGKILAELGVPGFVAFLWLSIAFARYLRSRILVAVELGARVAVLVTGLVALLVSNSFVFVVAHQAYGDPFVLILIAFMVGFILASHRWRSERVLGRSPAQPQSSLGSAPIHGLRNFRDY